jgi:replicative DNA helicase
MMTQGMVAARLTVVAGRPAMGKTAWVCSAALGSHEPCGIISSEMPKDQLGLRFLSSMSGVSLQDAISHDVPMTKEQWAQWNEAAADFRERVVMINDKPKISIEEIGVQARKWVYSHGIKVLYIDYLQRLGKDPKRDRTENIRHSIESAKEIARNLNIHVVMLSQVARGVELRPDKRPMMSDLDGAGTIEAEADLIVMLYREHVYDKRADPESAELIIPKHRHGRVGVIPARYLGAITRFVESDNHFGGGKLF